MTSWDRGSEGAGLLQLTGESSALTAAKPYLSSLSMSVACLRPSINWSLSRHLQWRGDRVGGSQGGGQGDQEQGSR